MKIPKIPKKKIREPKPLAKSNTKPLENPIKKKNHNSLNVSRNAVPPPQKTTKTTTSASTSVSVNEEKKFTMLTIYGNKGGTGKTAIAGSLSRFACAKELKVLVIDCDPLCNFTSTVLTKEEHQAYMKSLENQVPGDPNNQDVASKLGNLFAYGKKFNVNPIRYFVKGSNDKVFFDVIPGSTTAGWEYITRQIGNELEYTECPLNYGMVFRFLAEQYVKERGYNLVILDMNAVLGALNQSALMCSDYCLVPCKLDEFSKQSFQSIFDVLFRDPSLMNRFENRLKMLGFVPNMVQVGDDFKLSNDQKEMLEDFKTFFSKVFKGFCVDEERIYSTFFHLSKKEKFEGFVSEVKDVNQVRSNELALFFDWVCQLIKL